MPQAMLSQQIEALVDSIRRKEQSVISLTEVAAVTEVLMKTMQLFFRSVDLRIYEECQSLSDYISNARKEIVALQPENLEGARIPRAGKELDAIVKQTEVATNTIMEAAEEIMAADDDDLDIYKAKVQDAVMRIFEACSFQDITGQRISKVVDTLQYIEKRANELKQIMDIDLVRDQAIAAPEADQEIDEDKALLSGPALDGEGIDQAEVDALLETAFETAPAVKPQPAKKTATKTESTKSNTTKPSKPGKPKAAAKTKDEAPESPAHASDQTTAQATAQTSAGITTQADIDALFN